MVEIRRRQFLFAASTLLASPIAAAQRAEKMWRVGILSLDAVASGAGKQVMGLFPAALGKLGYKEGKNLIFDWRFAEGKVAALDRLAAELVRIPVEVMVARTTGPIQAAKRATSSIPIVMFNGNYPVELGLVDSLARPGGNVTGTSYIIPETIGKLVQLLSEISSRVRRIVVPWEGTATSQSGALIRDSMQRAADRLGVVLQFIAVIGPEQINPAIEKIAESRNDGLLWLGSPVLRSRESDFLAIAREKKLASISATPSGGRWLINYSPDEAEFFEQTARYVDRVLKGARPADLPVHQPTKYQLVVNLGMARGIGLAVPQSILARADRIID